MAHYLKSVFIGKNHTFFLVNQKLYAWGNNRSGQAGCGAEPIVANRLVPLPLAASERIVAVALGNSLSTIATSTGRILTCGIDPEPATDAHQAKLLFTEIYQPLADTERVVELFAGSFHIFALTAAKQLMVRGNNRHGECGIPPRPTHLGALVPNFENVPLDNLSHGEEIVSIAAGSTHSVLLTTHGRVFTCGDNSLGQCGLSHPNVTNQFTLVRIAGCLPDEQIIVASAAFGHSLLLSSKGHIYAAGISGDGRCGISEEILSNFRRIPIPALKIGEKISVIDAGFRHSYFLTSFGRLFKTGVYVTTSHEFTQASYSFTEIVLEHLNFFAGERIIDVISNNSDHTFILSNFGRLFVMGNNEQGRCALPDDIYPFIATFTFVGYLPVPSIVSSPCYSVAELEPFIPMVKTLCETFIAQLSPANRDALATISAQLSKLFSLVSLLDNEKHFLEIFKHVQWLLAFMLCSYQEKEYSAEQTVPEVLLESYSLLKEYTILSPDKRWMYLQSVCWENIVVCERNSSFPTLRGFASAFHRRLPSMPLNLKVGKSGVTVELHKKIILSGCVPGTEVPAASLCASENPNDIKIFDDLLDDSIFNIFSFMTPTDAVALALTSKRMANLAFQRTSPLGYFKRSMLPQTLRLPPKTPPCILDLRQLIHMVEMIKQYLPPHEQAQADKLMQEALAQQISTYYFYDLWHRIVMHPRFNAERPTPISLTEIKMPSIMGAIHSP